jgi:hypothetical protein
VIVGLGAAFDPLLTVLFVVFTAAIDGRAAALAFTGALGFTANTLTGGAGLCATALAGLTVAGLATTAVFCAFFCGSTPVVTGGCFAVAAGTLFTGAAFLEAWTRLALTTLTGLPLELFLATAAGALCVPGLAWAGIAFCIVFGVGEGAAAGWLCVEF